MAIFRARAFSPSSSPPPPPKNQSSGPPPFPPPSNLRRTSRLFPSAPCRALRAASAFWRALIGSGTPSPLAELRQTGDKPRAGNLARDGRDGRADATARVGARVDARATTRDIAVEIRGRRGDRRDRARARVWGRVVHGARGTATGRRERRGRARCDTRLAKLTFYGWRRRRESSGNIRVARYSHRKCLA